jgi:hypothetical protein
MNDETWIEHQYYLKKRLKYGQQCKKLFKILANIFHYIY